MYKSKCKRPSRKKRRPPLRPRALLRAAGLSFFLFGFTGLLPAEDLFITVEVGEDTTVKVDFRLPDDQAGKDLRLYRSTTELTGPEIDRIRHPVTVFRIESRERSGAFIDEWTAHNTTYNYLAVLFDENGEQTATSSPIRITLPDIQLENPAEITIVVDKIHYFLEVRDGDRMVKRYPCVLGRDPNKRKLHQDNRTTPEGLYKITSLQKTPPSTKRSTSIIPTPSTGSAFDS